MLTITIPESEAYDERTDEFIKCKSHTVQLEHSLVSLSKWESKWKKPFLNKEDKTSEETLDYIRCMTITQNVDPNTYMFITKMCMEEISAYIQDPMTATIINSIKQKGRNETVTSELIYYWMVAMNVPFECQKWHLNRLFTLINVCSIKNNPPKKMSRREIMERNRELNAERRSKMNTQG